MKAMKKNQLIQSLIGIAVPMLAGAAMLWLSWRKWPDVQVDFGMSLYIPWRLNEGEVLYRDIAWFFGPLSHYFNACLFRLFGTGMMTIATGNMTLVTILCILIYRFFLKTIDRLTAACAVTTFLTIFAFSQYGGRIANWNWVCPYTPEVPHGIILSFAAIYFFSNFIEDGKPVWWLPVGILAGMAALTKSEVFLAAAIALWSGFIGYLWTRKPSRRLTVLAIGLGLGGFLIPITGFILFMTRHLGFSKAAASLIRPYLYLFDSAVTANPFFSSVQGMDKPWTNLTALLETAGICSFVILILVLLGWLHRRLEEPAHKTVMTVSVTALLLLAGPALAYTIPWLSIARPLPLATAGIVIYYAVTFIRGRNDRDIVNTALPLFVFSMFSLILMAKIILNAKIYRYGFALAMPASLMIAAALVHLLPSRLATSLTTRRFLQKVSVILLGIVLTGHVLSALPVLLVKTFSVGEGRDKIVTEKRKMSLRGEGMREALTVIEELIGKEETFTVVPEGVMLNYLARRRSTVPYMNFMPTEFTIFGQSTILQSFKDDPPDFIIIADKEATEWGYRYFGHPGYGENVFRWILDNYQPVKQILNKPLSGQGFGILITRKK